jgi:hypothetical protein
MHISSHLILSIGSLLVIYKHNINQTHNVSCLKIRLIDMKMQNSSNFHGDANSRHQQLAPSVGRTASPLTNCIACQTSFLAFKDEKRTPLWCRTSPDLSVPDEIFIIRAFTLFHAPSERRPSFPRAGRVTTFLPLHALPCVGRVTTFLSKYNLFRDGKQTPLRCRTSPDLLIPGEIFIIRAVTLFHALSKRRPFFPRAGGVTPFLFTPSTRRRSDDLPFHVSSCARHVPVCADTCQAHANMLQAHAMCHVSRPHDATSASLLALIATSSV